MILEVHSCSVTLHLSNVISHPLCVRIGCYLLVPLFDIKRNMREAGDIFKVKEPVSSKAQSQPQVPDSQVQCFFFCAQLPPFQASPRPFSFSTPLS